MGLFWFKNHLILSIFSNIRDFNKIRRNRFEVLKYTEVYVRKHETPRRIFSEFNRKGIWVKVYRRVEICSAFHKGGRKKEWENINTGGNPGIRIEWRYWKTTE